MNRVLIALIALASTASWGFARSCEPRFATIQCSRPELVIHAVHGRMTADWLKQQKRANRVHLLFDHYSNLVEPHVSYTYPVIDENDIVLVHYVVEKTTEAAFTATIAGSAEPALIRVAGAPDLTIARRADAIAPAAKKRRPPVYRVETLIGGPFAGSVTISLTHAIFAPDAEDPVKSHEKVHTFPVNPLYHLQALGGLFYSNLADREFGPRAISPTQTVIGASEGEKYGLAFCLAPYVWESDGVDLIDLPEHGHRRLSPLIGFGFKSLGEDFYLGAAYQLVRGCFLTGGAHIIRTKELIGQRLGDVVPAIGVQQQESWQSDGFVGITFPLDIFNGFLTKGKEGGNL